MKKTTTNIPAAVFMQVPLDEGFTTEDVNKMLALLKLSPNEQFSFLEIPGESCIAQGVIREAVMEQNDFVCSAGSAFYKGVQSVLCDLEQETADGCYTFGGVYTMIVYPDRYCYSEETSSVNDTVYDPEVSVTIRRMGKLVMAVPFRELKKDDETISSEYPQFTCGEDAHISGDSSYAGYIVFDTEGNSYFPEDFGAALVANS